MGVGESAGCPELMMHQHEGAQFLLTRKSGILAFEQGLGKTRVAIESFERLLDAAAVDSMMVICPNSLKRTWAKEIATFAPNVDVTIVDGTKQERRRTFATTSARVVVSNYEAARSDILAIRAFLERRRCVLVLDESHYVKNFRSLNSIAAHHFAPFTQYRWLLSGTPVTNSASDIYPQLCLVAGERTFGSPKAFEARYAAAATSPAIRAALAEKVKPYLLRRTKEECLDLPEKTFIDMNIELPPWQRKLYDCMRDDLVSDVQGMSADEFRKFAPTALTRLLRLSQLASNPRLIIPQESRTPGKFIELDRVLEDLVSSGRKVIVWSYYVQTIEELLRRYERYGAVALFGKIPAAVRQDIASRFQHDSDAFVMVANPAAAGTGFTLTAATYAIYESLNWRYDLYAQSQDRNHRIGQRNRVTYLRLIAEETIERVITEALKRKTVLATELIGDESELVDVAGMSPESFCNMVKYGVMAKTDAVDATVST
jgi:SNF2 family DNA or RNA helicase